MHKFLGTAILIFFIHHLSGQPLRFFDKVDSVKFTAIDVVGDDKGGWLTLGTAEDSSFSIIQFDYCGKVIVNEKYALPANTKLHSPQLTYTGKDTLLVVATLASATQSNIVVFYSVGGIIPFANVISTGTNAINLNPVVSFYNRNNILLGFTQNTNGTTKGRIIKLDRNLNRRWSKVVEAESHLRWIKMLSDTSYAIGDGQTVRKFDTLGNNLWSRIFPEHQMAFSSVLQKDTQIVFLADFVNTDTSIKTNFKQVIALDSDGKMVWQSNRMRSMQTNYLLEHNSKLFFDSKRNYVFNAIDTVNGDSIPALFAYTLSDRGDLVSKKYWSVKDSVVDYKSSLLNDGNYGICISFGNADTLKGMASIKSTQSYEGACENHDTSVLGIRTVFIDPINVQKLQDSIVIENRINIIGHSDNFNIRRLCEVFDLKDGETPVPLCKGDSVFLPGITLPNATFKWDNGSNQQGIYVKEAGEYKVQITYCEKTITITYKVSYLTFRDTTFTYEQCDYPDVLYAFQGPNIRGVSYLWDDGTTDGARKINGPGTYKVTVTYCQFPFTQTFIVKPRFFPDETFNYEECDFPHPYYAFQKDSIKGITYKWDDGSTDGVRFAPGPGTYKVTVYYCNTSFVQTFNIKYRKFFDEKIDFNICEYPDKIYAFQGPNIVGATYHWNDGSTKPYLEINSPGTYKVTVNYCGNGFIQTFDISKRDFVELKFPNVLPPNSGDDINKRFKPLPNDSMEITDYKLYVFNRWGKLVYESTVLYEGWSGDFDGEPAPMDTYMYVATMMTRCGEKKYKGTVTLIR
jgi:gliding motility-associated-like protein